MTIRCWAVMAISFIRGEETNTFRPSAARSASRETDPTDALGVQAVERLVEDDRAGVAEQGGRDPEALAHAEPEATGLPAHHLAQAHQVDDLVHPGAGDAAGLRDREQVV
jgi:hypothetical protein